MNKKELISKISDVLRNNNIRKPVSSPKQVFHISDDEGNQKDFVVRKTEKRVIYTTTDVTNIIDACLKVVEDAIKHGEEVSIQGFGSLGVNLRAERRTKHPDTGEDIVIDAHYIPKFSFGNSLKVAAKLYEMSLDEHLPFDEKPLLTEDGEY